MQNINFKFFNSIEIETSEEIQFDMTLWPIDENGNPISKRLCQWDEANQIVILKGEIVLEKENALKRLIETDKEMNRKLEDQVDLLIAKGLAVITDYPVKFQELYNLRKQLGSIVRIQE